MVRVSPADRSHAWATRGGVPASSPHGVSRPASFSTMIMDQTYEANVRRVVAEQLGVGIEEIAPDVSLPDDLAADSLDLVELALALEARCGVAISDRRLETVRTYGDLLDVITTAPLIAPPPLARFRIVCDGDARADHAGPLDPYTIDILVEEARRAGP